ncbi:MAG: hypothetical protein A3K19_28795 [Lentisphaerae bacterium RIFOXYB12_FULL_65_16]|nr:MAG: hypothetical protein A3K18_01505 [Lentisphaerae bacterium RIFOXYA12_64_32]OGV88277.1 MAG: hypothetical protein A3K19_28795 [Lentisphaerae bacterium RIFOXYB12_FULL_65_16]
MIHFAIRSISLHRSPERFTGRYPFNAILFVISGMKYWRTCGRELTSPPPMFILTVDGQPRDGEYGPDREGWIIVLDEIRFRLSSRRGFVEIVDSPGPIQLPLFTPIPPERVPGWQIEFERIQAALQTPTWQNRFRAEAGVMNIFRHLADSQADTLHDTPAARLKTLIDQDVRFSETLSQLSRKCGYTSDHIRSLFHDEYGMSPNTYRSRRRLALAMELIANSRLPVKEVSARLGFQHVSAFSAAFRRLTGASPLAAVRQFRKGST